MQKHFGWVMALAISLSAGAAERSIIFADYTLKQSPPGFQSIVAGQGKPGNWQVIEDEVPSAMQRLSPDAPVTSKMKVLAQLAQDPTDEHFPVLVLEEDSFGDFTLTTSVKLVSGAVEQMAGIAFRIQDEKNFYVIRISGLGNNLRFYKMVGGIRSTPIGPELPIAAGVWHKLKIQCKGNQISCWMNDQEAFPTLTDNSFTAGKIGFWTKSDSVACFGRTDLVYTPRESFAQTMVRDVMKQYSRVRGLKIYAPTPPGSQTLKVIAADNATFLGKPATEVENQTYNTAATLQAKANGLVTVVMPLRDRNGEIVAAVHVVMDSFFGQTEGNVYSRAMPLMKMMQARIRSAKDLTD